jgi:hypothetical protein
MSNSIKYTNRLLDFEGVFALVAAIELSLVRVFCATNVTVPQLSSV